MSLQDLIAQRAALEAQIAEAQKQTRATAIANIKSLMSEHGITVGDLAGASKPATVSKGAGLRGVQIAPKFRHPTTLETWTGRGMQPRWLKAALATGQTLESFKIAA